MGIHPPNKPEIPEEPEDLYETILQDVMEIFQKRYPGEGEATQFYLMAKATMDASATLFMAEAQRNDASNAHIQLLLAKLYKESITTVYATFERSEG